MTIYVSQRTKDLIQSTAKTFGQRAQRAETKENTRMGQYRQYHHDDQVETADAYQTEARLLDDLWARIPEPDHTRLGPDFRHLIENKTEIAVDPSLIEERHLLYSEIYNDVAEDLAILANAIVVG